MQVHLSVLVLMEEEPFRLSSTGGRTFHSHVDLLDLGDYRPQLRKGHWTVHLVSNRRRNEKNGHFETSYIVPMRVAFSYCWRRGRQVDGAGGGEPFRGSSPTFSRV